MSTTNEIMEMLANEEGKLPFPPLLNDTDYPDEVWLQGTIDALLKDNTVMGVGRDGSSKTMSGFANNVLSNWDGYQAAREPGWGEAIFQPFKETGKRFQARFPEIGVGVLETSLDVANSLTDAVYGDAPVAGGRIPWEDVGYSQLKIDGNEWAESEAAGWEVDGQFSPSVIGWLENKISDKYKGSLEYKLVSAMKRDDANAQAALLDEVANNLKRATDEKDYRDIERFTNYQKYLNGEAKIGDDLFGLKEGSPMHLYDNERLEFKFHLDTWRNWLAKNYGDDIMDAFEQDPKNVSFMNWYKQATPSEVINNRGGMKRWATYIAQLTSATFETALIGVGTFVATRKPLGAVNAAKAAWNMATASMFVLEATDEYQQGINHWKSLGFSNDDARAMSSSTAINYGIVSSAIERFGAWRIYANKLGPNGMTTIKRNALGRLYDRSTKAVDDFFKKSYVPRGGGAHNMQRVLGDIPGAGTKILSTVSKGLPLMALESFQEVMQLSYQELLQAGYTEKDFLDGITEGGQLKDAILGGALGAMVVGPVIAGTSKASEAFTNVAEHMANFSGPKKDSQGRVSVHPDKTKSWAKSMADVIFRRGKAQQDVEAESTGDVSFNTDATETEFQSTSDIAGAIEKQWNAHNPLYEDYYNDNLKFKNRNDYNEIDAIIANDRENDSNFALRLYHLYQKDGNTDFVDAGVKDPEMRKKFKEMIKMEVLNDKKEQITKQWVGRQKRSPQDVENMMQHIDGAELSDAISEGKIDEYIDTKLKEQGEQAFVAAQSKARDEKFKKRYSQKEVSKKIDTKRKKTAEEAADELFGTPDIGTDIGSNAAKTIDTLKNSSPANRAGAVMNLNNEDLYTLARHLNIPIDKVKTDKASIEALRQQVLNNLDKDANKVELSEPKEEEGPIEKQVKETTKPKKTVKEKLLEEGEKREAKVTEAEDTRKPEDVYDVFTEDEVKMDANEREALTLYYKEGRDAPGVNALVHNAGVGTKAQRLAENKALKEWIKTIDNPPKKMFSIIHKHVLGSFRQMAEGPDTPQGVEGPEFIKMQNILAEIAEAEHKADEDMAEQKGEVTEEQLKAFEQEKLAKIDKEFGEVEGIDESSWVEDTEGIKLTELSKEEKAKMDKDIQEKADDLNDTLCN